MGKRNVGREIALSLLAAVVFGGAFAMYVMHTVEENAPKPSVMVPPSASAPAGPSLEEARAFASQLAQALGRHDYAAVYARMADPYRASHTLAELTETCQGSPILSGVTQASIFSTRRMVVAGAAASSYTFTAQGVLTTPEGNFDAQFTFLVREGSNDLRVLVLSVAGIPVLDGVSGR